MLAGRAQAVNALQFGRVHFLVVPDRGAGFFPASCGGAIRRRLPGSRSRRCSSTGGGTGPACRCWSLQLSSITAAFILHDWRVRAAAAPPARCSPSRLAPICCRWILHVGKLRFRCNGGRRLGRRMTKRQDVTRSMRSPVRHRDHFSVRALVYHLPDSGAAPWARNRPRGQTLAIDWRLLFTTGCWC
jgi:hypothetical protein